MKTKEGELNYIFIFVAILVILRNIGQLIDYAMVLLSPESADYSVLSSWEYSQPQVFFGILSSTLMIAALILTLLKRKVGVYSFFAIELFFSVAVLPFDANSLKQLPYNLGFTVGESLLFFGLLMIKRNGERSWNVIMNSHRDNLQYAANN